jgi:hypothetical protein
MNPIPGPSSRRRRYGGGKVAVGVVAILALVALIAPAAFVQAAKSSKGSGRPTSITLKYYAFGAASPASITSLTGNNLSQTSVVDQGVFTISSTSGTLSTNTGFTIGGKEIDIHTSCSAPIGIGMVFNDAVQKPAPDAPSIQGYNGPTAVELVDMTPRDACGNTATPTPSNTPTPTPTCPGGGPMPPSGVCPTPTPTPTRTPTPTPNISCPSGTNQFVVNGNSSGQFTSGNFQVTITFRNNGHLMDFTSNRNVRRVMVNGPNGLNQYNFSPGINSGTNFMEPNGGLINKSVFCWVTPSSTPTPTPTRTPTPPPCNCPTPTPTPPPCNCGGNPGTLLVQDFYGRTTSGTWTRADIGGPYTDEGPVSAFNVNNGSGAMTIPSPNFALGAILNNARGTNVDIKFKVQVMPAGGPYYVYAVARKNGNNEYRPRLIFNANGTISVHASVLVNGHESPIGSPVTVSGLSQCACKFIWFRAQVVGTNPTTIRVKAWAVGASEPGWQYVSTNSSVVCQGAGALGLRVYAAPSAAAPVTFRFDNYTVMSI